MGCSTPPFAGAMARGLTGKPPANLLSISLAAAATASSVGPVIVIVRCAGSPASASLGILTSTPNPSWMPLCVWPPFPIIRPTFELSTTKVLLQARPRPCGFQGGATFIGGAAPVRATGSSISPCASSQFRRSSLRCSGAMDGW